MNAAGAGAWSNEVRVFIAAAPGAPGGLSASVHQYQGGSVRLSWNHVSNPQSYEYRYRHDSNAPWESGSVTGAANSVHITKLRLETGYTFQVRAVTISRGTTSWSGSARATTGRADIWLYTPTRSTPEGNRVGVIEGNNLDFRIIITSPHHEALRFNYSTSEASATSPEDFTAASGTVTLPAGAFTATITIRTVNDSVSESLEAMRLTIDPVGTLPSAITLRNMSSTGRIIDNDD